MRRRRWNSSLVAIQDALGVVTRTFGKNNEVLGGVLAAGFLGALMVAGSKAQPLPLLFLYLVAGQTLALSAAAGAAGARLSPGEKGWPGATLFSPGGLAFLKKISAIGALALVPPLAAVIVMFALAPVLAPAAAAYSVGGVHGYLILYLTVLGGSLSGSVAVAVRYGPAAVAAARGRTLTLRDARRMTRGKTRLWTGTIITAGMVAFFATLLMRVPISTGITGTFIMVAANVLSDVFVLTYVTAVAVRMYDRELGDAIR